jgi:hypothetical protein
LALHGFEVPRLCRFVKKGFKIHDKPEAEVGLVIYVVVGKMSEPLERVLSKHDQQVCCHGVLCCPGGVNNCSVDVQLAARVLHGLVLVDV